MLFGIDKTWNRFLFEKGNRSEAEYVVKTLPEQYRNQAMSYFRDLNSTEVVSNPQLFYNKQIEFGRFLEKVSPQLQKKDKSFIIRGSSDLFGYRPAGTRIWYYFANPFGVFAYISQQCAPAQQCLDLIRTTINKDGYFLVAAEGVSERKLMRVYEILQELNIDYIYPELAVQLKCFGNAWLLPEYNHAQGLEKLKIMYPQRLLPIFERTTEEIIAWEYLQGRIRTTYAKDQLLHLMLPSAQNDQLGAPPWVPCVTKIETSIQAQNLNNTVFQKGGLIQHLISLKQPNEDTTLNTAYDSQWVDNVQKQFDYLYSGSKAGQGNVVVQGVEKVFPMTDIGALDQNWTKGDEVMAKMVAQCAGIPSEKIGIPRSSTAQYTPEVVEVVVNSQFDDTINDISGRSARFLTRKVMKGLLGINDVKMIPAGRFGALTLTATQCILNLASAGPLITYNQAFEDILGWEPLPPNDPRGQRLLDITAVRATAEGQSILPPEFAPVPPDPELYATDKSIDKIMEMPGSLKLKVGGLNDGSLYKNGRKIKC